MSVRDLRVVVQEVVHSLWTGLWTGRQQVVRLRPDPEWAAERAADRDPVGGYCRGCGVGIDWLTVAQLCHRCVMGRTRR